MNRARSRRRWPRRLSLVLLVTAGLGGIGVPARPVTAQVPSVFEATANAEAARIGLAFDPPIVQEELANPAALAAQARLTSLGQSSGYASHPYPGDFPVTVPGLVSSAILQGAFSVPPYPLIATSSHPSDPDQSVVLGTVDLSAHSGTDSSMGVASDGANRSVASVTVDRGTGTVTATATIEIGSIHLGELLSVAGVRSSASAERAPGDDVATTSRFSVSALRLLGQEIAVTADGLSLAGTELPLGLGGAAGVLDGLLATLAESGTTVRFLPSEETASGIVSAGLEIVHISDGSAEVPASTVTVTLGRAAAFVDNRALPTPGSTPVAPIDTSGTTGSIGVATPGGLPSFGTAGAGAVAGAGSTPTEAPAQQPVRAVSSMVPELVDGARFYPVMVFGGLAVAGLSALLRRWGLRPRWTS